MLSLAFALLLFGQVLPYTQTDCAVAYVASPVVLTFGSSDAALVEQNAGICTQLIASGEWVGVSKYGEWKDAGVYEYAWMTPGYAAGHSVTIWTGPDLASQMFAHAFTRAAGMDGWIVFRN